MSEFYVNRHPRCEGGKYQAYCKKCTIELRSDWYYKKGGKEKVSIKSKKYRDSHKALFIDRRRKWNWDSKMDIINKYGGKCECCGETNPKFLSVDHIKGKGNEHRKTIGTVSIYIWLRKNNYPSGFQILCYNCNNAKAYWGVCPHQEEL